LLLLLVPQLSGSELVHKAICRSARPSIFPQTSSLYLRESIRGFSFLSFTFRVSMLYWAPKLGGSMRFGFILLVFLISFSTSASVENAKFQSGLSFDKCLDNGSGRICELFPFRWETVLIDVSKSNYGFHEQRIIDDKTGMEFTVFYSVSFSPMERIFDLHIALRTIGDSESWTFHKVRLAYFRELNEIVFHPPPFRLGGLTYEPRLMVTAP